MRFVVKKEIFEELPSACFGVVMAKGIDNNNACFNDIFFGATC